MHQKSKSNNTAKPAKTKAKATKLPSTRVKRTSIRTLTTSRQKKSVAPIKISTQQPQAQLPSAPSSFSSTRQITPHTIHFASGFTTHVTFDRESEPSTGTGSIIMPKSIITLNQKQTKRVPVQHTALFKSSSAFSSSVQRIGGFNGPVVTVQNGHFFTSVTQKIKSVFGSTSQSPQPQQSQSQQPRQQQPYTAPSLGDEQDGRYQLPFQSLPKQNQKHIENVMARFRAHLANRSNGASSPITAADKAEFIATVSAEELESLQVDQGSQHFFQLLKPTKRLSNLPPETAETSNSSEFAPNTVPSSSTKNDKSSASAKLSTLDKNSPDYDEMMANHTRRYHEGELNAKMESRRAQMIKDSLESDVLYLGADDVEAMIRNQAEQVEELQKMYENNPDFDISQLHHQLGLKSPSPAKEITMTQNQDGTVSFGSPSQSQSQSQSKQNAKVQVPVDGTPTSIGMVVDPRLLISFICDMCNRRNVKSIPKDSYEKGVVLIRCECTADHLIADNLGWFDDGGPLRIDRIMREDKNEEVFKASVLDTQKEVRHKMDMTLGPDDIGKEIGHNHISPEMLNKINEALAIAREQDETKKEKFKHFHQQDIAADELKKKFEALGQMPMLPAGKTAGGPSKTEKH